MMRLVACLVALLLCAIVLAQRPGYVVHGSYYAVIVTDIETASARYATTLGLEETSRPADEGRYEIVDLGRPGLAVELLQLAAAAERPEGYIRGPFKVGMLVADLAALPAVTERPRLIEDKNNGLLLIQLRDPEGNIVQVMQQPDEEQ